MNKDEKHHGKNFQEKVQKEVAAHPQYLSGHALCVISAVCPIFIIAFFRLFWFLVHGIYSVQVDLNASSWTDVSACILCGYVCPCVTTSKIKSE